jgi:hypothetical protein
MPGPYTRATSETCSLQHEQRHHRRRQISLKPLTRGLPDAKAAAPARSIKITLRINNLVLYLGLRGRRGMVNVPASPINMIKSRDYLLSLSGGVLFHLANALGLSEIVLGDGNWRRLRHLFARLHAVAQERDEYVDRAAALAARLLLYGRGEVAGLYLLDRLR